MPTQKCEVCGKQFKAIQSRVDKGQARFCSYKCKGIGTRTPRVKCRCGICGKSFFVLQSTIDKGYGKFCSQKCMGKSYENKVERNCRICKKIFYTKPAEIKKGSGKYCSYKCMGIAYRKQKRITCIYCGKKFNRQPSEIAKAKNNYCSAHCQYADMKGKNHPNWKGGITSKDVADRVGRKYFHWRKKVFKRDKHTCRKCGKKGGKMHGHHLYSFTNYPHLRFNTNNGHTLCRDCHIGITRHEHEYLIEIGLDPLNPPF